jgi:hypothetical protein
MSKADHNAQEELRNLLRSADRTREATTPVQSRYAAPDQDLKDLASLIGSLDIDLTKTVTKERPSRGDGGDHRAEVSDLAGD